MFGFELSGHMTIIIPGLALAIFLLAAARMVWRRGGAVAAFLAVLVLGVVATWATRYYALKHMIPNCEAAERAARAASEAVLYDCTSEGLIVAFPVMITLAAAAFVLVAGIFSRLVRRG